MERDESYSVKLVVDKGLADLYFLGLRYDVALVPGGNASECCFYHT